MNLLEFNWMLKMELLYELYQNEMNLEIMA